MAPTRLRSTNQEQPERATEFQPWTATPAHEGDDGIGEQTLWTLGVDTEKEEQIGTELESEVTETAGPGEEIEAAELETATNDGEASPPSSPPAGQYPFRHRHASKTFTYDRLGQPTVH